jgi:hypothetical protein
MSRTNRRPNPERIDAQGKLQALEALERLSGEELGRAPQLWLIREGLDRFNTALRDAWSQLKAPLPIAPVRVLDYEDEDEELSGYWLRFDFQSALENKPIAYREQGMDIPNAALAMYAATKRRPEAVVELLQALDSAAASLKAE